MNEHVPMLIQYIPRSSRQRQSAPNYGLWAGSSATLKPFPLGAVLNVLPHSLQAAPLISTARQLCLSGYPGAKHYGTDATAQSIAL